ncbi:crotonase/enoyl-CoA hydratase family protein [Lampropedia aestuarii]|uniref:Crotonase/enoyl-CoA hydratase family protein n=1 Tax=Lampropedia aestuarii TaxID=2562762 RepID=A0A4S5BMD5_9BURK|nr:crotonase/enoyl-CoA hydratase family protein [Lampropedia aestuarii]MDH5856207.1 crotonase/enoyl-CoA hydratase family protein [Lampropedia aestuarii]THJ33520.1 crotonase/enoyl-CoA hydratase family protein [Lampropedia aestuarii]
MAAKHVLYEKIDNICVITLNKPERRNAIDGPMAIELREAFERFNGDDATRVAILTGTGGSFCAGGDLTSVGDPTRRSEVDPEGGGTGPLGPTRMVLDKPLIAAINGYAVAGGLELAVMADMRVADEDAVFGVFCRRWGVPLIDGGTVRLPRIVGMGHAMDMILTGRPVSAPEAQSMGLVNRITPTGGALEEAKNLARQIAAFPQACMLADRRSAHEQWGMDYAAAIRNEGRLGAPIVQAEGVTGAARFVSGVGRHGAFEHKAQ